MGCGLYRAVERKFWFIGQFREPHCRAGALVYGVSRNYGVIATGNHFILIRCTAHHTGRNSWTFGLRPTQPGTNSLIGIADNTGNEGFCLKNRCKNFDTARRGHAPALQPSIENGPLNWNLPSLFELPHGHINSFFFILS